MKARNFICMFLSKSRNRQRTTSSLAVQKHQQELPHCVKKNIYEQQKRVLISISS